MTKFTRSERLAAAMAVEAGDSLASVARQFGMSRQVVTTECEALSGAGGSRLPGEEGQLYRCAKAGSIGNHALPGFVPGGSGGKIWDNADPRRSGNGSADTWKTGSKGSHRRKKAGGRECQSRKHR